MRIARGQPGAKAVAMGRRRAAQPIVVPLLAVAAAWFGSAARAQPAPGCCAAMLSDQIAFRLADPGGYEVVARLEFCNACLQVGPSNFRVAGRMTVRFGPYTLCNPVDGDVFFTVPLANPAVLNQATGPPNVKYVPADAGRVFPRDPAPFTPLRTSCTAAANLDYVITNLGLNAGGGAVTPFDPVVLTLPTSVRARNDVGARDDQIALPPMALRQSLTFETTVDHAAPFRLWPDGLPFRLAPDQVTYEENQALLVSPVVYESAPPSSSNIPYDAGNPALPGVVHCNGADCATDFIYNGAYFHAGWQPSGAVRFDAGGLDVLLDLPGAATVVYEPAFPRGVKLLLDGPAAIQITEGAIETGSFGGGDVRLQYVERLTGTCDRTIDRLLPIESALPPQVRPNGAILAGVSDLTPAGSPFEWAYNSAASLGCGSLFVPPVLADRGPAGAPGAPQIEWLASALAPVAGRGLYAGINYNRHRVCADDPSEICTTGADCAGGVCQADLYSPKCPALGGLRPAWSVSLENSEDEGGPVTFEIVPGEHAGREMAFVARGSGVTGVFDGGQGNVSIGDPFDPIEPSFDVDFNRFGLAFLRSSNDGQDSLLRGQLNLPWPSATDLPFDGLSLCDCGSLGSAQVPEAVAERKLGYWDETFRPYGLDFTGDVAPPCTEVASGACCDPAADPECSDDLSRRVCVTAQTPIPHYTPEPDSVFGVDPPGRPDAITPVSTSELTFDRKTSAPTLAGYSHHVEHVVFSDWAADGSPGPNPPGSTDCDPCGYMDVEGELSMPLFGLSPAAIKVQKKKYTGGGGFHLADLHEIGFPTDPLRSAITVARPMAADTLDLSFKLDYFPPSTTADPQDGTDLDGRGSLLGFSFNPGVDAAETELRNKLNLGAMPAGAAVLLRPQEILADLGPAGALRLWATTGDTGSLGRTGREMLDGILPADRLADWAGQYDDVLSALGGQLDGTADDLAPDALADVLRGTGLLESFGEGPGGLPHPDFLSINNVAGAAGVPSPDTVTDAITGYLDLNGAAAGVVGDLSTEVPELARAVGNIRSLDLDGREFFAFEGAQLDVLRHVRDLGSGVEEQAITALSRVVPPIGPGSMELPGKQAIDFPASIPGLSWDFDYTQTPGPPFFRFNSLTGNLDLTRGGLSGLGFNELGATLKFYADGDWYFEANAEIEFGSVAAEGDLLLGNTKDLEPLRTLDPDVVDFLGEIPKFDGAYVRVGVRRDWLDFGCLLTVDTRVRVGGWYIGSIDSYGGLLVGRVSGEGACVVSVAGELTMIGGQVDDLFRLRGDFWVAGGMGWDCDRGGWDRPADVLGDGGCFACVIDTGCEFTYPGSRLSCDAPRHRCR